MKKYTIHHFITPLLNKGYVDGEMEPELFEALMNRLPEVKDALYPLGATVVSSTHHKGVMLYTMGEEELDAIAEREGSHPIVAATQKNTMDYKSSTAVTFFRRALNQEEDLGGEELWIPKAEVETAVRQSYARVYDRDEFNHNIRIKSVLDKLIRDNIVAKRTVRGKEEYRGTKWLALGIDLQKLREFEALAQEVLALKESQKEALDDEDFSAEAVEAAAEELLEATA